MSSHSRMAQRQSPSWQKVGPCNSSLLKGGEMILRPWRQQPRTEKGCCAQRRPRRSLPLWVCRTSARPAGTPPHTSAVSQLSRQGPRLGVCCLNNFDLFCITTLMRPEASSPVRAGWALQMESCSGPHRGGCGTQLALLWACLHARKRGQVHDRAPWRKYQAPIPFWQMHWRDASCPLEPQEAHLTSQLPPLSSSVDGDTCTPGPLVTGASPYWCSVTVHIYLELPWWLRW